MLVMVATMAACEDSRERAERHFQSGLSLLEEGEVEKALVEFRNVFNLDGSHREARRTYARTVREQGKLREAYGQYLRLVEQYPDDIEGRIALAEMAFVTQNWEEFDRHTKAALELAPEDPRVRTLKVASDYRAAVMDEDAPAREAAFQEALALLGEQPDNAILLQIEIDGNARSEKFSSALDAIDRALANDPDNRQLYMTRLAVLARLEDLAALETQLRAMVERFPEDEAVKQALIRFYITRNEPAKAEDFLREIADPQAEPPELYMALLQFINEQRGPAAVLAELEKVIPQVGNPLVYEAMRAQLKFEQGDRSAAIAETEALIEGAEPSAQLDRIKVNLARMLMNTGNEVGARRLVEEVLANDPTQVDALRMNAAWQIQADNTDAAIATLRAALDQAPQDVTAMTLMSQAYLRAGNRDLARDFLSLAVDASAGAPAEAIRYARFLLEEDRPGPAEQTLVAALRQNRNNPNLLIELGRVYLQMDDRPRLRQVVDTLKTLDSEAARKAAAGFETSLIERQSGTEAALSFLEGISEEWSKDLNVQIALIRARLAGGDTEGALAAAQKTLDEDPEAPERRYLMAATQAAAGNLDAAEEGYRALLEGPEREAPGVWLGLIRVLGAQGRNDEIPAVLDEALAASPGAPDLLWVRAGILERAGDIDGAIAIYEDLYAQNSNSVIVANNLASLLSTHRDDPESIERAARVAARLSEFDQPAFRDTWGWVTFLQGKTDAALPALEAAAEGLPNDGIVQYHLGRVYEALERSDEALAQYRKAVELAGPAEESRPIADARARLEALRDAPAPEPAQE